jgi:hypothetical protein
MKRVANLKRAGATLALVATLSIGTGCVLVVGNEGRPARGDVEWSTGWDRETTVAPTSVDDGLARDVEARLQMDSSLAEQDLTVSSHGDVVTLHGRVSDLALLDNAVRTAADVPGVARVVSRVTVDVEVD